MSTWNWMLEVQIFDDVTCNKQEQEQEREERQYIGKFVHVGYMKKIFNTKKAAVEYYNVHNPHMRTLNAHGTWKSDWDPTTRLRYIPRVYHGVRMTLASFD